LLRKTIAAITILMVLTGLLAGCGLADPGEFPEVAAETVEQLPADVTKKESQSGTSLSAAVSAHSFNATAGQTIYYALDYEDGTMRVRCNGPDDTILFSSPEAAAGIYAIPVGVSGRYQITMSYQLDSGGWGIYLE